MMQNMNEQPTMETKPTTACVIPNIFNWLSANSKQDEALLWFVQLASILVEITSPDNLPTPTYYQQLFL